MSEEEGRERAATAEGDAESVNDGRALVQAPERSGDVITPSRAVPTLSKSMFNAGCFSLPYAWKLGGLLLGFCVFWFLVTYLMAVLIPKLGIMILLVGVTSGTLCALIFPPFFEMITFWTDWKGLLTRRQRMTKIFINCVVIYWNLCHSCCSLYEYSRRHPIVRIAGSEDYIRLRLFKFKESCDSISALKQAIIEKWLLVDNKHR